MVTYLKHQTYKYCSATMFPMMNSGVTLFLCVSLIATFLVHCHGSERKAHIVYMGAKPPGDFSAQGTHYSMLESVLGSASLAKDSLIYSYGRSMNGFAAMLSDEEVEIFSEMESVVSVIPNRKVDLHTTRSWDFMGFSSRKLGLSQEGDAIIGVIDTGIWPESESFNDEGMSAPPAKWKGKCTGANFTCNKKIIGGRFYNSAKFYDTTDFVSPRDADGHGTHTSSTAAGREVSGATFFGLAEGTARGGAPGARIAAYKVCWSSGCYSVDILAAFDDAIADGVDIISVSLGFSTGYPYLDDPIAIGSFHAMRYGILTSSSAGNNGPYSVSNSAPWTLTVAASTIDRKFIAQLVLGNGQVFAGVSINKFELNQTSYPLIWGGDAVNFSAGANQEQASDCFTGGLNSYKVGQKIVLCTELAASEQGLSILSANGLGAIIADSHYSDFAFSYLVPATVISYEDGARVLDYIRSTENPIATILHGETWKDVMAPVVVSFSSRGPNLITPDILKPDITAPGVDILAAWSPVAPPTYISEDKTRSKFNIISGTSMSCPHVSGAAAYVKAAHPNWSPAAIKSALMTTAMIMDPRKHIDLEFAYGSGHLNPFKATDPGLVYDASEADYINFLCKQGYNTSTLRMITGTNDSSCHSTKPGRAWDLNYPSFALAVEDGQPITGVFTRTVTNVGSPDSTYIVTTTMPSSSISVTVEPSVLSFSATGEKKTFKVKVSGSKIEQKPIMSGSIVFTDGVHVARSPLVVYNILPGSTYSFGNTELETVKFKKPPMYPKNRILGHN